MIEVLRDLLEQLTPRLREAAVAATSNVIVFRSGPREEVAALRRLGSWPGGPLTRLQRFQAAATVSQGHRQSDAFTLVVDHNDRTVLAAGPEGAARGIRARSRDLYSTPFRTSVPVTAQVMDAHVDRRIVSDAWS